MAKRAGGLSFNEAMEAATEEGARVSSASMSKGWYVYVAGGQFYSHNPYHGPGPSMRDHVFTASEDDMRATWWKVVDHG
jgi:hypothetical protein